MSLSLVRRASTSTPRQAIALPTLPTNFSNLLPTGYVAPPTLLSSPKIPRKSKGSLQRQVRLEQYQNLLSGQSKDIPILIFFQHKDFSSSEWSKLRESIEDVWKKEIEKIRKIDPSLNHSIQSHTSRKPKITVLRKSLLGATIRNLLNRPDSDRVKIDSNDEKGRIETMVPILDYLSIIPGPKAVLSLPYLSISALSRILKLCQRLSTAPNPRLENKSQKSSSSSGSGDSEDDGTKVKIGRWALIEKDKREKERFFLLGSLIQGISLNEKQTLEISNGPELRELQSMIVGMVEGTMGQVVGTLEGVGSQLVWTLEGAKEKLGDDQSK